MIPARRARETTRWRATATTLGPTAKMSITCMLVLPILVCVTGLSAAGTYRQNAFFVVPLWFFGVIAVVVLPAVWERG